MGTGVILQGGGCLGEFDSKMWMASSLSILLDCHNKIHMFQPASYVYVDVGNQDGMLSAYIF